MKIENVEVYGFQAALRGMRNPMNSWDKSDTLYYGEQLRLPDVPWDIGQVRAMEFPMIGPEDLELALSLICGGGAHRKFLRQIMVWWDITIPRAIWQELDTYKIATVRNSCSTMHKLGTRDLEWEDFEGGEISAAQLILINRLAYDYRTNKTPERLHRLKMHLPESFLQKATFSFSYETGLKMYFDRENHRMPEWSGPEGICAWITKLPYMPKFIDAMLERNARG